MAKSNGGRNSYNSLVVPGAEQHIERFKNEIAAELGVANYDTIDKGALPARVHGMIGGTMTKRLIEMGQRVLAGMDPFQSDLKPKEFVQHMQQDLASSFEAPPSSQYIAPEIAAQSLNTENQTLNA